MQQKNTDQELIRLQKLKNFSEQYGSPYEISKSNFTLTLHEFKQKYANLSSDELKEKNEQCTLSGRIVALRQTFLVIQSMNNKVQLYINKNKFPIIFDLLKKYLDVGDIIEATGSVQRTHLGELTLFVSELHLLAKSLKPLPEKYHGLTDPEIRARKRYLDLIANPEAFNTFLLRSKMISCLRRYLDEKDFVEVETPILTSTIGGAAAKPFKTYYNSLEQDVYLRIATEIALKKLIVGGFEKVYEIGRVFRNEGMDANHNPEFSSIEIYQAYANMDDMMALTEQIVQYLAKKLNVGELEWQTKKIDLQQPFQKVNMQALIQKTIDVDFSKINTFDEALAYAQKYHLEVQEHQRSIGHVMSLFFEEYCEKNLLQPTFVIGYPVETSPLAKRSAKFPKITERFELFILGKEIANAYSELNDPLDQRERFKQQLIERQKGNNEANDFDEDFLEALEYGMPPTGGLGIGIDRLVMLLTKKTAMREVLLFPHMKNLKSSQD